MRTAQSNRIQLHKYEITDHLFRQIGVLTQLKRHVLENSYVSEERAELEQHAHAAAQLVQTILIKLPHLHAIDPQTPAGRSERAANQPQQRGLATAGIPHDGDDLSTMRGQIDVFEHRALAIGEREITDFDEVV